MITLSIRRIIIVFIVGIVFVGAVCNDYRPALARSDFRFDGFTQNVQELVAQTLEFCRDHAADTLDTTGVFGPLSSVDNFRRACGQGTNQHSILYAAFIYFYQRDEGKDGWVEVIGVKQELAFEDATYELIIGEMTRAETLPDDSERRERRPVATMFAIEDRSPVWNYVDPIGRNWTRPNPLVPEQYPAAIHPLLGWLDDVWRREVTIGTGRLVRSIRDAR